MSEVASTRWAGVRRRWASGRAVLVRATVSLLVALVAANVFGAVAVYLLVVYVVPEPAVPDVRSVSLDDIWIAVGYVALAVPIGVVAGFKKLASLVAWLPSEQTPTLEQQLVVLRGPRNLARAVGVLWAGATALFGALAFTRSLDAGLRVTTILAISGLLTGSVTYRLAERILREAAGRALAASPFPQRIVQSVAVRSLMTWLLGTGVPVLGIVLLGIVSLWDDVGSRHDLAFAMAILGGNCLVAGAITTIFATRATADPILSVRRALARIEQGDLDVTIPVYDGTDVGLLQAGFNRMAAGLRERERLRDLFGRHVGDDVVRRALEHGVELGGEQRHVAVLYIDLVGSTALAARRPAQEVVEMLNRFFGVVVEVVESAGGLVNKFAGDAALAIFGAPAPIPAPERAAIVAARMAAARLCETLPEVDFGIGVSAGTTVAGNVGATSRLEYTVIGDPVNEAARLGECAKTLTGRVAVSGVAMSAAGDEAARWARVDELTLRGRTAPTAVFSPLSTASDRYGPSTTTV